VGKALGEFSGEKTVLHEEDVKRALLETIGIGSGPVYKDLPPYSQGESEFFIKGPAARTGESGEYKLVPTILGGFIHDALGAFNRVPDFSPDPTTGFPTFSYDQSARSAAFHRAFRVAPDASFFDEYLPVRRLGR